MTQDRGSGLFGLVGALMVFLILLLVAVHVLFHLYARSVVTSTAEAAARAATRNDGAMSCSEMAASAVARVRTDLGQVGRDADVTATCGADVLELRVVVTPPSALPAFAAGLGIETIDRTVTVRIEELQP